MLCIRHVLLRCLPCKCYFPAHPGNTSIPDAQLADHSELVRAAARALAARVDAAHPHALASAARAMAHLGALAILILSSLAWLFSSACPDLGMHFALRQWCLAHAAADRNTPVHLLREGQMQCLEIQPATLALLDNPCTTIRWCAMLL